MQFEAAEGTPGDAGASLLGPTESSATVGP